MSLSVPDRWLKYKPYGEPIKDTKLLPLKVPLKEAISRYVQPEERFTPAMLLEAFPNLKYIIDLTNTYRYYDRNVFTEAGVRYEKVMIPGQKVPAFKHVERFFQVMDDFMSTSTKGDLIGIHCTHGVNRTGYLICRYLIQQLGWEVGRAIKEFEEARGHAIEREAYLSALKEASRGEKIDTSSMNLAARPGFRGSRPSLESGPSPALAGKRVPFEMGPPPIRLLALPRRMHEGPFPPQQFSFGRPRPGFGSMPPPPPPPPLPPPPPPLPAGFKVLAGMPQLLPTPPPPLPAPSPTVLSSASSSASAWPSPSASPTSTPLAPRPGMFGPRGCRLMPRLRPPMSPPFRKRPFPSPEPPPIMDNPGNMGQVPIVRLPLPPVLPSSRPPPLPRVPAYNSIRTTKRKADAISGTRSDQDFTADTFEENLLEGPSDGSDKCKRRLRRPPNGPRIDTRRPRMSGMPMKRR